LLLIHFAAAAAAAVGAPSTEGRAFAVGFARAMACAADAGGKVSLDRDQIDSIPSDVLKQCAAEAKVAVDAMARALPASGPTMARDNVEAKMRREAQTRLIARLERNEAVRAGNEDGYGLERAGVRYLSCMRLAINFKLEGVHLGEDWPSEVAGLAADQREGYFVRIGRAACPQASAGYAKTLAAAMAAADPGTQAAITRGWNVDKMNRLAVGPYVRMAADFHR
jgi:hypothetical protein